MKSEYALLDSGHGRKLERFGPVVLARPCAQAVWAPRLGESAWQSATAAFDREDGLRWHNRVALPDSWIVEIDGLRFRLSGTDFGHLGVFPEQRAQWDWIARRTADAAHRPPRVLNLFAYSGGSTLAAARAGAEVCHLDASRGMVEWAKENAGLNRLREAPIRWIVDDALKFLLREQRRGVKYDGIILDPPTFGRGKRGELFKIEEDIPALLDAVRSTLSPHPRFVLLTAHTPGLGPVALDNLLRSALSDRKGRVEHGEMMLTGAEGVLPVPSGAWARWHAAMD
ncbi:MAG: class I SAM-dependent methyltransferase [Kiritimatiellae bacterium]|nr:class I SAM-dependent methyltransferase [Kiritimatiellia bacterium]